jgi:hypothetical protein
MGEGLEKYTIYKNEEFLVYLQEAGLIRLGGGYHERHKREKKESCRKE